VLFVLFAPNAFGASAVIDVSVSRARVERGETVAIQLQTTSSAAVHAVLLTPNAGTRSLTLKPLSGRRDVVSAEVGLDSSAPEGLYLVHAWTGDPAKPSAVGKGSFLLGRLVTDFFIASYVDSARPVADVEAYLKGFRAIGGNSLVAHNLISPSKAFYPSRVARTDVVAASANDLVELILDQADKQGLAVLLSVSWDMTRQSPFNKRMDEIKAIAKELYELYKHHPSLGGFYSYQEGSGTYYAPFVREFCEFIKSLNRNLLTACAPHVDDPLLAGYLSVVEELDIIIYQAGVMASYRTDNRKKYPFRRVKDFCALGAGAKRLQNKIAIVHVELFGYLENRLNSGTTATTYQNIYQQILSGATVTKADGISFFTYHAHVYEAGKKLSQVERSRAAVADGVKAFMLITGKVSRTANSLAVYFPYSDWIIERWHNYFLPALDGFRTLGVPVDLLPYAPPLEESVYPYYPFHHNQDVLDRLLADKTVLILPNVSGFQQTDSDLIKAFIEQGGVVVAFGPQVPMGRSYERTELFGIDETDKRQSHNTLVVKTTIGTRAGNANRFRADSGGSVVWKLTGARVVASFEDGSPAVTVNKFGKGTAIVILLDAQTAAERIAPLVRDVLEYALSLRQIHSLVDIIGAGEMSDMAIARTSDGFRVALVNHDASERSVVLKPTSASNDKASWIDLGNDKFIGSERSLRVTVPAQGFRSIEFRRQR
jgi:uncharacterized protein DUF4434